MIFKKDALIESDTQSKEGPSIGPEAGLTSLLIDAINGEWETISEYNTLAIMARENGYNDLASVIDEINTEENKHVGQLQELLEMISPNASAIKDGQEEASEQLGDDDISWYKEP